MIRYRVLSAEEKEIIEDKHTERPFSGLYNNWQEVGVFVCKRCQTPLYVSSNKFDSSCGWPSFDEALLGSVKKIPDGNRVEIVCASCQAHLGHVFLNERFTPKNTRHCVNSLSLSFAPAYSKEGYERALFAGGCFWGVEYFLKNEPGVIQTRVGYIGGCVASPTYEEVCLGKTGHVEVTEVFFNPEITSYRALLQLFFEIHDPTQKEGQGPDLGPQYRSSVFYLSDAQEKIAISVKDVLAQRGMAVVTEIKPASIFYPAEEYHQAYYGKTGGVPYCHHRVKRF